MHSADGQCGETQAWDKALPAVQAQTKLTLLTMQVQCHFQALTVLDHSFPAHLVLEQGVPGGSPGTLLLWMGQLAPEHLLTLTTCSEQGCGCPGLLSSVHRDSPAQVGMVPRKSRLLLTCLGGEFPALLAVLGPNW